MKKLLLMALLFQSVLCFAETRLFQTPKINNIPIYPMVAGNNIRNVNSSSEHATAAANAYCRWEGYRESTDWAYYDFGWSNHRYVYMWHENWENGTLKKEYRAVDVAAWFTSIQCYR